MATVHPHRTRPWLVMLFLAGDNSLNEDMVLALQDIQAEGAPAGDRLFALLDPSGAGQVPHLYDLSLSKGTRLEACRVTGHPLLESNTGNPEMLAGFICWAVDRCKDRDMNYFLILSGHGSGATEDFLLKGENPVDSLTIAELKSALGKGVACIQDATGSTRRRLDMLGMDACYMSMGEVAFEIRDSVDILIGAEGLEPTFGWPYRRILAAAKRHRRSHGRPMSPAALGEAIVREYVDCYSDYDRTAGRSVDLAALDLTKIDSVRGAFEGLVKALNRIDERTGAPHPDAEARRRTIRFDPDAKSGPRLLAERPSGPAERCFSREFHEQLVLAHWYAQTYKSDQFVDLKDLCEQIKKLVKGPGVGRACDDVIRALRDCVICAGCSGFACQHSHGLSIYFPWGRVSPDYRAPAFGQQTGWLEFLRAHVHATRRESRYRRPASGGAAFSDLRKAVGARSATEPFKSAANRVLEAVNAGDIPLEDAWDEISRRALTSGRHTDRTKHSDRTKHTDHTKGRDERDVWVKNLPAVIGTAFWK